jgi:hypothetical protein
VPDKALSFPDMWDMILRYREHKNPITPELMAVLFFEESLFCNIIQFGAGRDAAVGFGQMQIFDLDKIEFFRDVFKFDSTRGHKQKDLTPVTREKITNDKHLSVKIMWKYYQWLHDVKKLKTVQGIMGAQAGSAQNKALIPHLVEGAKRLRKSITKEFTRESFIESLNYARRHRKVRIDGVEMGTAVPYKTSGQDFRDFWHFVIPDGYLRFGF